MMDLSLDGIRCRTSRRIAHHRGYLAREVEGTIRYSIENIGRTLLRVDFDTGESLMLLPDDVTLEEVRCGVAR
jgi:hypothetical protein